MVKIRLLSQHVCSFEDVIIFYSKEICKAQWLSWLERRPVTAEVVSSSLIWVVTYRMVCAIIEYVGS